MMAHASQLEVQAAELAGALVDGRQSIVRADGSLTWCDVLVGLRELQRCYFGGLVGIDSVIGRLARLTYELGELADTHVRGFLERELVLLARPLEVPEAGGWRDEAVADAVPTMNTPEVLRYYRWLARTAPLAGTLLDLGCWYGASTCALAAGVAACGATHAVIAADKFRCEPWMLAYDPAGRVGESFLPRFQTHCQDFGDRVIPVCSDVGSDDAWARALPGPVGLVLYDLDRSRVTLERVFATLGSRVIAGKTVLVLGTYGHLSSQSIREWVREAGARLQVLPTPPGQIRAFTIEGTLA